jgi:4-amino-4-deoxy-L-arabinose transferase-like glycosyltransferase
MMKSEWIGKQAKEFLPAVACGLALLVVILLAHPGGEVPASDDVSFIHSAQVLAQTGRIAYNGFVAPILGWQLYWAAAFLRLFGDSLQTARLSMSVLAVLTAFFCQRTLRRAGISSWNASVGTLTLVLSPMFAMISVTFMTDVPACFAMLVCVYACMRALQAQATAAAAGWIVFAALSNALLGTTRQTAWMGFLLIVPAALWMLRRRRTVLVAGAASVLVSAVLAGAILYWFQQHPYIIVEGVLPPFFLWHFVFESLIAAIAFPLALTLFLLPILVVFLPALMSRRLPWPVYTMVGMFALGAVVFCRKQNIGYWAAPYVGLSFIWPFGLGVSLGFTVMVVLCWLGLAAAVLTRETNVADLPAAISPPYRASLPYRSLLTLLLPFAVVYTGFTVERAGFTALWDRYTLPLLLVLLILLLRFYQDRGHRNLPVIALIAALCYGGVAAAITHDDFVVRRARLAMTELTVSDHVYAPRMRLPKGAVLPKPTHYGIPHCLAFYCTMYPHVLPKYTLASQPAPGFTEFPPVPYRPWILPPGTVYVVPFP